MNNVKSNRQIVIDELKAVDSILWWRFAWTKGISRKSFLLFGTRYCLLGALWEVQNRTYLQKNHTLFFLRRLLPDKFNKNVPDFNDSSTFEEVKELLQSAIMIAEKMYDDTEFDKLMKRLEEKCF